MTEKEKKSILQLLYAGQIIENSILSVNATQAEPNVLHDAAQGQIRQFGIHEPEDVLTFFSEVPGFARWQQLPNGLFQTSRCTLLAIAMHRGVPCPCEQHCTQAMQLLLNNLTLPWTIEVLNKMPTEKSCILRLHPSVKIN